MTEQLPRQDRRNAVSSAFRRQLGIELGWLRANGILPDQHAAELARLYAVDDVGAEGSQKLVWVIFLVGVLLIGCGVVALVAWHWEEMSQTLQLLFIISAMLTAHASGYLLWFHGDRPRLGHALVLLGTLLFFANIALIAQIFHVPSDGRSIWLALAVGAAAVTIALDSVPHFCLAAIGTLAWSTHFLGSRQDQDSWFAPLLAVAIVLTWRIVRRSGSSLALRAGWFTGTILAGQVVDHLTPSTRGENLVLLTTLASGAVAAGLAAQLRPRSSEDAGGERSRDLAATLETVAAFFLAIGAFAGGFLDIHRAFTSDALSDWMVWGFAMTFALVSVANAGRRAIADGAAASSMTLGLTLAALIAIAGSPAPILAAITANIAVLVTGAALGFSGVRDENRGRFWFGTILVLADVLARFFEYETNLWLKSAAFIASGALVLILGIAYERRIRRPHAPTAPAHGTASEASVPGTNA